MKREWERAANSLQKQGFTTPGTATSCNLARKACSGKDARAATAAGHNRRARSIGLACMVKSYEKQRLDKLLRASTSTSMSGVFNKLPGTIMCSGERVDADRRRVQVGGHQGVLGRARRRRTPACSSEPRAPRCARVSTRRRRAEACSTSDRSPRCARASASASGGVFNKGPGTKLCVRASASAESGGAFNK